jgi:hypothetical protein
MLTVQHRSFAVQLCKPGVPKLLLLAVVLLLAAAHLLEFTRDMCVDLDRHGARMYCCWLLHICWSSYL